jgi:hypothetical protein
MIDISLAELRCHENMAETGLEIGFQSESNQRNNDETIQSKRQMFEASYSSEIQP